MFLDRLSAELATPQSRLSELDDRLHLDVDRYRALMMQEARALCESGQIDAQVVAWAFACIADGWVDEHLQQVRDSLLELGAVADQGHLDRLLRAALLQVLGTQEPLQPADAMLLDTVTQPPRGADAEPLGLRLMARRYARELGLLGGGQRTRLGEVALRMPRAELPVFLLALEALQSTGPADRWRAPKRALALLLDRRELAVPTTEEARRALDPEGLMPWRRARRLTLMGLIVPVTTAQAEDATSCLHRLLPRGEAVLRQTLAEPPGQVVTLAAAALEEHTRESLRPLLGLGRPRDAALAPPVSAAAPRTQGVAGAATARATEPQRPWREMPPRTAAARAAHPVEALQRATELSDAAELGKVARATASMRPAVAVLRTGAEGPRTAAHQVTEPPVRAQATPRPRGEDICQLLQRAWDEIQARGVQFALLGTSEQVGGERRALLQILREVLRCAADAATRGARTPLVRVEVQGGAKGVTVLISDNGPPRAPAETTPDSDAGVLELLSTRSGALRISLEPVPAGVGLALPASRLGGVTVQLTLPRAGAAAVRDAA